MYRLIFLLMLTACSLVTPYQVAMQQGNVIDQAALQLGMDKKQVLDLLGAPLLNDPYHTNTWEYVYTNQINGGPITIQHLILEFNHGQLTHYHAQAHS